MGAVCYCCLPEVERARAADVNDANTCDCVEAAAAIRLRGDSRSEIGAEIEPECEIDDSDNDSCDDDGDDDGYRANSARHRANYIKDSGNGDDELSEIHRKYILYPDPESPPTWDTAARRLWEERLQFLKMRPKLAHMILEDVNRLRTGNDLHLIEQRVGDLDNVRTENDQSARMLAYLNCARSDRTLRPLAASDRLNKVALRAWLERAQTPDGFVAIPGCAYNGFGCLTYYSPRTRHFEVDCLSQALMHFFLNNGGPADTVFSSALNDSANNQAVYFPSRCSHEVYTHRNNCAFRDSTAKLVPQLLSNECSGLGLYIDMVMTDECEARNLVCVLLIFDQPVG